MYGAPPYGRTDAQTSRALTGWEGTALLGVQAGACRQRVGNVSHVLGLGDPDGSRTWEKERNFCQRKLAREKGDPVFVYTTLRARY